MKILLLLAAAVALAPSLGWCQSPRQSSLIMLPKQRAGGIAMIALGAVFLFSSSSSASGGGRVTDNTLPLIGGGLVVLGWRPGLSAPGWIPTITVGQGHKRVLWTLGRW